MDKVGDKKMPLKYRSIKLSFIVLDACISS